MSLSDMEEDLDTIDQIDDVLLDPYAVAPKVKSFQTEMEFSSSENESDCSENSSSMPTGPTDMISGEDTIPISRGFSQQTTNSSTTSTPLELSGIIDQQIKMFLPVYPPPREAGIVAEW